MFARTSTWSGSPEALQKWSDNAREKVKGFVEGLPGNAGVMFLVDRKSGTALTLTLWDSEGAAEATDQFAEQSHCLKPAGSDPDYTLDCEEPDFGPSTVYDMRRTRLLQDSVIQVGPARGIGAYLLRSAKPHDAAAAGMWRRGRQQRATPGRRDRQPRAVASVSLASPL